MQSSGEQTLRVTGQHRLPFLLHSRPRTPVLRNVRLCRLLLPAALSVRIRVGRVGFARGVGVGVGVVAVGRLAGIGIPYGPEGEARVPPYHGWSRRLRRRKEVLACEVRESRVERAGGPGGTRACGCLEHLVGLLVSAILAIVLVYAWPCGEGRALLKAVGVVEGGVRDLSA